jgi:5'(3')-deoxyribonucleotidase
VVPPVVDNTFLWYYFFMPVPSPEAPVVLIDMDGVLADFDKEILSRLGAGHPRIPIAASRTNFYIAEDYPEHTELVRAISNEKGFFASLPLVDNALHGWNKILEHGYAPRICSSPISTNPYSKVEKLGWLEKHFVPVFGGYVVEQAIITKDKDEYDGIALIDDRPEVRNTDRASWQHIIFDRPYNRASQQPRLYGWEDDNLLELLKMADMRSSQN